MQSYKNIGKPSDLRTKVILLSLILMLVSLFVSRAGLSIGMMLFCSACFVHKQWKEQWKNFISHRFLIGITLLFLIPFITGLWSSDREEWSDLIRIKLPLLLFPLAFAGTWQLAERSWKIIAFVYLILCLLGSFWSVAQYLENTKLIHEGYLRAKVFQTPLQNDHVRFSWMITAGIMTGFLLFELISIRIVRVLLVICCTWLAIYLHILSARTGLFCFYIFVAGYVIHLLLHNRHRSRAIVLLLVLMALPLLAWLLLPTFQNRVRYIVYDLTQAQARFYQPGSNDGNRILSLRAGWDILKTHPFGVGTGDVFNKTNEWYDQQVPGMLATDRLYPSSEWMIYGAAAGWPGMILFTLVMLLPLYHRPLKFRFYWVMINLIAAASFIFDIGLEVQFGVFLYVFTILWWWKWLNPNTSRYE